MISARTHPSGSLARYTLLRLAGDVRDWRKAFRLLRKPTGLDLRDNIRSQGANIGEIWKPLDPNYAIRKRRGTVRRGARKRSKPLILTGALQSSVRAVRKGTRKLTKVRMEYGSRLPYAYATHRDRPWIAISTSHERYVEATMYDHLEAKLGRLVSRWQSHS